MMELDHPFMPKLYTTFKVNSIVSRMRAIARDTFLLLTYVLTYYSRTPSTSTCCATSSRVVSCSRFTRAWAALTGTLRAFTARRSSACSSTYTTRTSSTETSSLRTCCSTRR